MLRNIFEEDHEMFRDSVAKFLQAEVTPHLERWLDAGIIDRDCSARPASRATT
jgi:hypothetical protein